MDLRTYLMIKKSSVIEKAKQQAEALVGDPYAGELNILRDANHMGKILGATPTQTNKAAKQVLDRYYPDGDLPPTGRVSSPTVNAAFNNVMGTSLSSGSLGRVLGNRKLFNTAMSKHPEVFSKLLKSLN